jgi:hypothetical protein
MGLHVIFSWVVIVLNLTRNEKLFVQKFNSALIDRIESNFETGISRVVFSDGAFYDVKTNCDVYNEQYGIPISSDCKKIFVSNWETGLHCYDIKSGTKLWQMKGSKITNVYAYQEYIVAVKYGDSIIKIDQDNGLINNKVTSGTIEKAFDIEPKKLFVSCISGVHCIFDCNTMSVVKKYPKKIINPNNCLSVILQNVVLRENVLIITGFEEYPNGIFNTSGTKDFIRTIDY